MSKAIPQRTTWAPNPTSIESSSRGKDSPDTQRYIERLPRPELRQFVSCVWALEVSSSGPAYEHRTVPNGCAEIAGALDTGQVRIVGPRRESALDQLNPGTAVVGVRFHPGVSPSILGPTGTELLDLNVDVDVLWGRRAATLGERLLEAFVIDDAATLLEEEVLERSGAAAAPDPFVNEAVRHLQPWKATQLADTASQLFISPRQLRRRFLAAFGFGPKTVQRLLRFQGFLALTNASREAEDTIGRLAALAGYSDQAHLSHECARLTGLVPRSFVAELRSTCGPNHDHAASFAPLRRALLPTARHVPHDRYLRADR